MRKIFFFFCLCFCKGLLTAQTLRDQLASPFSLLQAYSTVHADVFSFAENQGAMPAMKQFSAGLSAERRFFINELTLYRSALLLPTSSGNFGIIANYFGTSEYNESSISVAYGRRLGKIDLGLQFNDYLLHASTYGTASSINCELGFIIHMTEKFQTGMHVYNPTRSVLGKYREERLPLAISAGLGYDASPVFYLGCRLEKSEGLPLNVDAGFHYSFSERISVQLALSSASSSFYLGVLLRMKDFLIGFSAGIHPQLGTSPGLLFLYQKPALP
ncbi:MAG: hypothetical protein ACJ75B_20070 [Flavisolibacter sp.]